MIKAKTLVIVGFIVAAIISFLAMGVVQNSFGSAQGQREAFSFERPHSIIDDYIVLSCLNDFNLDSASANADAALHYYDQQVGMRRDSVLHQPSGGNGFQRLTDQEVNNVGESGQNFYSQLYGEISQQFGCSIELRDERN